MIEKIKVSREVADAIEKFIRYWVKDFGKTEEEVKVRLIGTHNELKYKGWDIYECGSYKALGDISTFDLMKVLVNGYEVEMTPREQIAKAYDKARRGRNGSTDDATYCYHSGVMIGIRTALDALNITVKGVNDNDN